jgi:hypothetical protein
MTANAMNAADSAAPLSVEAQAAALWTFVHLRTPRFDSKDALQVVQELGSSAHQDVKALARQLRTALTHKGVALKHTHALEAAARLLGHASWHAGAREATVKPLQFVCHFPGLNRALSTWDEAIQIFSDYCEGEISAGGLRVYRFEFTPGSVSMDVPLTRATDQSGRIIPLLQVQWQPGDPKQLPSAIRAVESVRRRFEETGRAVIDGLAAPQFCQQTPPPDSLPDDPVNSELVVVNVASGPSFGEEIARGDETKCWYEMDQLHPRESSTILFEEGHWVVGLSRYEWSLTTIRAGRHVPEIRTRRLTSDESARLLRRYRLAARAGRIFFPEDRVKNLLAMRSEAFGVDVDWEKVRLAAISVHLDTEVLALALPAMKVDGRLSLSEFQRLVHMLDGPRPSELIGKPKRSRLALLENDELLRTFVSRVQDVIHEVPRSLDESVARQVQEAVDMFHTAIRMDVVTADGTTYESFPRGGPYLIHANQGKELLTKLKQLGLVAYAGLMTNVDHVRIGRVEPGQPRPLKIEHLLFLDIDYAGARNEAI